VASVPSSEKPTTWIPASNRVANVTANSSARSPHGAVDGDGDLRRPITAGTTK
jgi:hypothetical protein